MLYVRLDAEKSMVIGFGGGARRALCLDEVLGHVRVELCDLLFVGLVAGEVFGFGVVVSEVVVAHFAIQGQQGCVLFHR